jgi:hypothetical protein
LLRPVVRVHLSVQPEFPSFVEVVDDTEHAPASRSILERSFQVRSRMRRFGSEGG